MAIKIGDRVQLMEGMEGMEVAVETTVVDRRGFIAAAADQVGNLYRVSVVDCQYLRPECVTGIRNPPATGTR